MGLKLIKQGSFYEKWLSGNQLEHDKKKKKKSTIL